MRAERRVLVLVVTTVVLAAAGVIEAVRLGEAGLAVVLVATVAAAGSALVALRERAVVGLRRDLADWAEQTCAATGEPPERLVDRAVSAYRSQLDTPEDVAGDG
jgi:hypothetical protein